MLQNWCCRPNRAHCMRAFFSLQHSASLRASLSLSTRSFCESILFVRLEALRCGERRAVCGEKNGNGRTNTWRDPFLYSLFLHSEKQNNWQTIIVLNFRRGQKFFPGSNWILQLRTGSGSDWISWKSTESDMNISTALVIVVKWLIRGFLRI